MAGDAHDIGKNIVIAMLRCASYEVIDLGVDVPLREFLDKTRDLEPTPFRPPEFLPFDEWVRKEGLST